MAGVKQTTIKVIEQLTIRADRFHHALEIWLHEVALNFLNARVDVRI